MKTPINNHNKTRTTARNNLLFLHFLETYCLNKFGSDYDIQELGNFVAKYFNQEKVNDFLNVVSIEFGKYLKRLSNISPRTLEHSMKDLFKDFMDEYAESPDRKQIHFNPQIDMLDEDKPWDTFSVISKLVEAADILLHKKDYDGHGWEEIEISHKRGLELLKYHKQKNTSADNALLSADFLVSKGFKLIESRPFENLDMPYYVKQGVLLFFNTPVTEWNKSDFLVASAEMRCGKYYAVTFRWIKYQKDIDCIYKAVTGKNLSDGVIVTNG